MSSGLSIQGLVKRYGRGPDVLKGLNLELKAGDIYGVIGPNGSGKTTLMSCLLGLVTWQAGDITIGGDRPQSMEFKRVVGFLPERLNFDRWMTARNFLEFHHHLAGMPAADRTSDSENLLKRVGIKEEAWDRKIEKFSRGMLQRVGLAQALIGRPRYLMLDEPTSGMDPRGVKRFKETVKEFAAAGGTVVINSHQLEQVSKVCTRVGYVLNGVIKDERDLSENESAYTLIMKFSDLKEASEERKLRQAANSSGAKYKGVEKDLYRFDVESPAQAATLLKDLFSQGLQVCEANRESNDLEDLFDDDEVSS